MTTIVWHKRHLYTDSRYLLNGEQFDSLTKVIQYTKIYRVFSEEHKTEDRLLGFFSTGSQTAARGIMDKLCVSFDGNIDLLITMLKAAHGMNLVIDGNKTEVLLVGNKNIYSINFGISNIVQFRIYDLDRDFHVGSGGEYALTLMASNDVVPLRAMHAALYKDDYSGGLIDVWQHFHADDVNDDAVFARVAIDDPKTDDMAYSVANPKKPYTASFVHSKLGVARWVMDIGARKPEDVGLLKQVMAEVNAKRDDVALRDKKIRESKKPPTNVTPKPKGNKK